MTYQRPTSVWLPPELDKKATDLYARMSVYVDNFIHKDDKTEGEISKLYEYIYHIAYMLSCKSKMWDTAKDYDEFSLYVASRVYVRMTNPRQFSVQEGERSLKPIKSVLNYLKFVLPKLRVRYQEENFTQVFSDKHGSDTEGLKNDYRESIQKSYNDGLPEAVQEELSKIAVVTKHIVNGTPYRKDKLMTRKIYMSCLLTLLNNFTLTNKDKIKIQQKIDKNKDVDETLYKLYDKESESGVILWRLDDSLTDYIEILVKKIKHKMVENIGDTTNSFELPDETLDQIWMSAWSEYVDHNEEDF